MMKDRYPLDDVGDGMLLYIQDGVKMKPVNLINFFMYEHYVILFTVLTFSDFLFLVGRSRW